MVLHGPSLASEALKQSLQITRPSSGEVVPCTVPAHQQDEDSKNAASYPYLWNVIGNDSMKLSDISTHTRSLLNDASYCNVYTFELTSRVLTVSHTHTLTYKEEIIGILDALRENINSWTLKEGGRCLRRLVTNNTCALHVHAGNGDKGFPLQTVKHVSSVTWTVCTLRRESEDPSLLSPLLARAQDRTQRHD
jgi:hypothetical protein